MAELEALRRMRGTRPPAVAGLFYPARAEELAATVDGLLAAADPPPPGPPPVAVVAPHAGYPYSGPVAASAFVALRPLAAGLRRVVLLGPSHRVPFRGLALPAAERFSTPLGEVEVDLEAAASLLTLPQVTVDDAPHTLEHGLEVEIPFLQRILGSFRLVPLVVGSAVTEETAEVLERVWGGEETVVVVSSDLSHFLDYDEARRTDRRTAEAIRSLRLPIAAEQACGALAVNGLLAVARARRLAATLLDLRSSGDTAGGRDRVVGYGAFSFAADGTPGGGG